MNSCTNEVDVLDFIEVLDLPDTYYSWFLVSELHLWMVSVRLMSEGCKDCQEVRNWMVKIFWEDCDARYVGGVPRLGHGLLCIRIRAVI